MALGRFGQPAPSSLLVIETKCGSRSARLLTDGLQTTDLRRPSMDVLPMQLKTRRCLTGGTNLGD